MTSPSDGHIWPWFGSILTFQFEPNVWFQIRTRTSIAMSRMVLFPVQLIIHSKNPHSQSESNHDGLVFWSIVLLVRSNRWPRGFHHFPAIVDRPFQVFQHCLRTLPVLIVLLSQTKPSTWPKIESTACQSQTLDFLAKKLQRSSISVMEKASVCAGLAGRAYAACTNHRETFLWWMPRSQPMTRIPIPFRMSW